MVYGGVGFRFCSLMLWPQESRLRLQDGLMVSVTHGIVPDIFLLISV